MIHHPASVSAPRILAAPGDRNPTVVGRIALVIHFLVFGLALTTALAQKTARRSESVVDEQEFPLLEPGRVIKRDLTVGQQHIYRVKLQADQFLKATVKQLGIDVMVQASGPNNRQDNSPGQLWDFDAESRPTGREHISLIAETDGEYRIVVQSKKGKTDSGGYEIRIDEIRAAGQNDRALQDARKIFKESVQLLGAGKYNEAAPLIERALEIRERLQGPDHYDVAATLNLLAGAYRQRGEYARAAPLYERSLSIFERILEPEDARIAISLNNLAGLYWDQSDFVRAEPLARRSLEIAERALGSEHPNVAMIANTLATLYSSRGDFAKAGPLFERSLAIWERTFGPEHSNVGVALSNLANIYHSEGQYARAESFYKRALAMREKALGAEHAEVAATLNNLAITYTDSGEYAKAEPIYQRALAIREKTLGPEHPRVGLLISNLATLYGYMGEPAKSEPLYGRALAILEKTLGLHHPSLANTLNDMAVFYASKGEIPRAVEIQARANEIAEYHLTRNLAGGSERQKLAYLAFAEKQTDFTFLLHSRIAPNDSQALDLAFTTLLRQKGRGLDAMTDTIAALRRHAEPQDQRLFDRLIEARSQLASLILKESEAANLDAYRSRLGPLEENIENLESELSARSARFRALSQPVTLSAVRSALAADSALLEYAIHTPRDPRTGKRESPRYLVYLLTPQGPPKFVDLGEAAPIDRAVEAWRQSLRDCSPDVKQLARAVDERVMHPMRSLLRSEHGEIRRLLIAPDGLLHLAPFAALVDEKNQYLIERYIISYLTSGRDLLRLQTSLPSENTPLIIANPLFGRPSKAPMRPNSNAGPPVNRRQSAAQSDALKIIFRPLPGTAREAIAIKALLPDASLLLQRQATKAALKQVSSPRILHIATHGFFLRGEDDSSRDNAAPAAEPRPDHWRAQIGNPLLRSGLALAGANQGENGAGEGLLTALEIAGLDLWGTKLVVLSACDTGLGEVKNGEGIQGLRRALVLAGSETQIISLWTVPDEWAKDVMIPYYRALRRGEGRSEALRLAQLRILQSKNLRHPFYWATFIQSGEWASLNRR
jgi:CHAT domain-containing protein/tetratricopeptide (TPR) repeat protein